MNNKQLSFVDRNFPTFKAMGILPFKQVHKFLDNFARKGITTGQTLSRYLLGRPLWGLNYDPTFWTNRILNALEESGWVYACADAYTKAISSIEFTFQIWSEAKQEWEPFEDHPALERFEHPNPTMSGNEMVALQLLRLWEDGNFITGITDSTSTTREDVTLELWDIDPSSVAPIPDRHRLFSGYAISPLEFNLTGEKVSVVGGFRSPEAYYEPVRNIVHGQLRNPKNPLWGLPAYKVIRRMIETEVEAMIWNRSMLSNRSVSSGQFITKEKLNDSRYATIKEQIAEQHQKSTKAWQPWILHSGFEWKESQRLSPVEMDFIELFKMAALITCAVLKVPPPVIGLSEDATLANLTEYKKEFWDGGVIPNVSLILNTYNRCWVRPRWGPEVRLWYDLSKVNALKQSRSEKLDDALKMKQLGIPIGIINTNLDLGLPDNIEDIVEEHRQKMFETALVQGRIVNEEDDDRKEKEKQKEKILTVNNRPALMPGRQTKSGIHKITEEMKNLTRLTKKPKAGRRII